MDPCVPGISLENARAHARIKLGVPAKYANKMSVTGICKAVKSCKTIIPPMEYKQFKGKIYLIDPKSPFSIKDFILLLGNSSIDDIKRLAKNVGLVTLSITKSELKSNIIKILQTLNISEPIELPIKRVRIVNRNGTNLNNVNRNGTNSNGSLGPESGETPYSGALGQTSSTGEEEAQSAETTGTPQYLNNTKPTNSYETLYSGTPHAKPSKLQYPNNTNSESITQARINESIKLANNLKKQLSNNNI